MHWDNRVYLFSQSSHDLGIYKVAVALTLLVKVGLNNFLLSEIFLNHRSLHKEEKRAPLSIEYVKLANTSLQKCLI